MELNNARRRKILGCDEQYFEENENGKGQERTLY